MSVKHGFASSGDGGQSHPVTLFFEQTAAFGESAADTVYDCTNQTCTMAAC